MLQACYQGFGPDCVKLLLDGGADVFRPNFQNMTALEMTANQVIHCKNMDLRIHAQASTSSITLL